VEFFDVYSIHVTSDSFSMSSSNFTVLFLAFFLFAIPKIGMCQFSGVHVEEIDNDGLLAGTTYRVYVKFEDVADRLDAVMPFEDNPIVIHTSSRFYQHPKGSYLATNIKRGDVDNDLTLAYDSWVTIGLVDNYLNKSAIHPPGSTFLENFENSGQAIVSYVQDPNGGAWFVRPDEEQGIAGEDSKVLIGQFTTSGTITGLINIMGRKTTNDPDLPENSHKGLIQELGIYFTCPSDATNGLTRDELLQLSPR